MNTESQSRPRAAMYFFILAIFIFDLLFGLWKVREEHFISVSIFQFTAIVWGILTGTVTVAATLFRIGGAVWRALRGSTSEPQPFSIDETIRKTIKFCSRILRPLPNYLSVLFVLILAAYLIIVSHPLALVPTSSSVVVISKGAEKFIYVAASDQGEIQMTRATDLTKPFVRIPVGTSGNLGERGRPEQMIAVKHGQTQWIFATDTKLNKVHVIEGDTVIGSFSVGLAPRALAVTPDNRKLFVSNEQPIPSGTIQVFDIDGQDPNKFFANATIQNVTCPEGLALSPLGNLLYVATQCGGGKDPVFVVNTATNKVEGSIPNLAVGNFVAVNSDGTRLYVSRGNFPCKLPDGEKGSPLSVVDLKAQKIINTICFHNSVGPIAISRDKEGRYLFVGNGNQLTVFDRKSLDHSSITLNDIPFLTAVSGIGVAEDNSVYAFVPGQSLLFFYNPAGL